VPDRLPRRLLRRTLGDFAPLVAAVVFGMVLMLLAFLAGVGVGQWRARARPAVEALAQLLADAQTLGIEAQEAAAAVAVVCGIP